jgi:hypothetical protein
MSHAQREMAIATGETRPITQTWPGGGFNCPWCGGCNPPAATHCNNPACWASQYANADLIRAEQARRVIAARDVEARRAAAESATRAHVNRQAAESKRWAEFQAEANERGACVTCLRKSDWRSSRPKFVKHRSPDHHADGA